MAIHQFTDTDWKIFSDGKNTLVFWKGNDVSRWVTGVTWEHKPGGPAKATVSVVATVEATLSIEHTEPKTLEG